ncbi:unnamed protein product, partial [Ectocarpus sp. 13 AM-2016]
MEREGGFRLPKVSPPSPLAYKRSTVRTSMIAQDNRHPNWFHVHMFGVLGYYDRFGSVQSWRPPPPPAHPLTRLIWANVVYTSFGALPPTRSETDLIASSFDCEQCSCRSSTYPWDTFRGDLLSMRLFCRRGGDFLPPDTLF